MIETGSEPRLTEKTSSLGGCVLAAHGGRDSNRVGLARVSPSPGHRQLLERHFPGDELVEGPEHDRLSTPTQLLESCVLALALEWNLRLRDFWRLASQESPHRRFVQRTLETWNPRRRARPKFQAAPSPTTLSGNRPPHRARLAGVVSCGLFPRVRSGPRFSLSEAPDARSAFRSCGSSSQGAGRRNARLGTDRGGCPA